MTALAGRLARMGRLAGAVAAGAVLASPALFAEDPVLQIPGPPLLPTSRGQCEAYSRNMEAMYAAINEQHQDCLDARANSREPSGPKCSKAGCESLHQLKDDLSEVKSKNTSSCYAEVSEYERVQRSRLDSLQDAQRRAQDLADSFRAGPGADPSPPPDAPPGDAASMAGQLAAVFGRGGGPSSSGSGSGPLPSLSFQNPFSDKTRDALRDVWQKDVKQLLLDGLGKVFGDHQPLGRGLDTALSSAETLRGTMDFLTRMESASSSMDRFNLASQGLGAATRSGFDFTAGRGWLPPSYAASGFAFEHAVSALNVAVNGSFERLQYAFARFDAGGAQGWDYDRMTDFNSLQRDMVLALCPVCDRVIRIERAVTSTYGDMAQWFAQGSY